MHFDLTTPCRIVFVLCLALAALAAATSAAEAQSFVHPGLLHTRADLTRMKDGVAAHQSPIYEGFEVFAASPQSQSAYVMRGPFAEVGRNPTIHQNDFDQDANAAYQCALMWAITGDKSSAAKSRQILTAWAATLKTISGADAVLMAGLGPFKMVNAAEILRYTDPDWTEADTLLCETLFRTVVYPVVKDFALFANGNWDTAAIKTMLAIGVFCDDRPMFERALRYYVDGAGDGRLTHYIYSSGQCQESGRDQAHAQLGLGHLGDCCQIAWNQGLDLYSLDDNRLLKGFEYTAEYNLGHDVPFTPDLDQTGKYAHSVISTNRRGVFRPLYEQIYNHYVNVTGIPAPYTQEVAEQIRPEGAAQGADHPGFGTLLYSRPRVVSTAPPKAAPGAPGGLIAQGEPSAITVSWVASVGATGYSVKRADGEGTRYVVIASDVQTPSYRDSSVQSGDLYSYVVSAANASGRSPDSSPVGACAGLPSGWSHRDVGAVAVPGASSYDGWMFTLDGSGSEIGGLSDQCQFASVSLTGDGSIIARFVPQVSCQFSEFGLMMRETSAPDAPQVSLLLTPQSTGSVEAPSWHTELLSRESPASAAAIVSTGSSLPAPTVTYGRLMQPYWLQLSRRGGAFTASVSSDGRAWILLGTVSVPLKSKLQVGLAACSRKPQITTTVMFDHVTVTGRP